MSGRAVAIHQPHYLPWLGYLAKLDRADCFVYLDTVQFEKNGWQNRNTIKGPQGAQWLTVPVRHRFGQPISEVAIAEGAAGWRRKHRQALALHYGKAPHFAAAWAALEALYKEPHQQLANLAVASVECLAALLGIRCPTLRASALGPLPDDPTDRLVAICQHTGAATYLTGASGPAYMDLGRFARAGVTVLVQEYCHPEYPQRYGPFLPNLSAVDMICNAGTGAEGLAVLRRGGAWRPADEGRAPKNAEPAPGPALSGDA